MKTALTIAGTDPSGGAGIQADIKTMTANGVFATCAVTALVAQNTTGVKDIVECTPEFLAEELDCVFTDIFPDAVKTGMVSSIPLIETIAAKLKQYGAKNVVVDPVMVATSGDRLISEDAVSALKELLLPLATVLTPQHPGGGDPLRHDHHRHRRHGGRRKSHQRAVRLRRAVQGRPSGERRRRPAVAEWRRQVFRGRRIDNPNTHGTGCTLSSAIASNWPRALTWTRRWSGPVLHLRRPGAMLDLGRGSGPMDHMFDLKSVYCQGGAD